MRRSAGMQGPVLRRRPARMRRSARMRRGVTARGIEKLAPGRREVPDAGCPGLYVVVGDTGHKSFALRSRSPSGKTFKLTLGGFTTLDVDNPAIGGPLTLAAARQLATALLHDRARGIDIAGRRPQKNSR